MPTLSPRSRDSRVRRPPYSASSARRLTSRIVPDPIDTLRAASPPPRLYLCTDARRERGDLAEFADAALAGGVDLIQLRDKGSVGEQRFGPLEARDELAALEILGDAARTARRAARRQRPRRHRPRRRGRRAAPRAGRPAAAAGPRHHRARPADRAVHARRGAGGHRHRRSAEEVDYFCVGPCWPTPTKPGRPAPGLDLVRDGGGIGNGRSRGSRSGAIDAERLPEVLAAGARRIVVVRAITAADDPAAAARDLKSALTAAG